MAFIGKLYENSGDGTRTLMVRCILCGDRQDVVYSRREALEPFVIGDDPFVIPLCKCYDGTDNSFSVPLTMVEDV